MKIFFTVAWTLIFRREYRKWHQRERNCQECSYKVFDLWPYHHISNIQTSFYSTFQSPPNVVTAATANGCIPNSQNQTVAAAAAQISSPSTSSSSNLDHQQHQLPSTSRAQFSSSVSVPCLCFLKWGAFSGGDFLAKENMVQNFATFPSRLTIPFSLELIPFLRTVRL